MLTIKSGKGAPMFMALWYMLPEYLRTFLIFSVSGVNLYYTVALSIVMIYWLFVIIGAFDLDVLDMDMDGELEPGPLQTFADWMNIGEVPIMLVLSLAVINMWIFSMLGSIFLGDFLIGIINLLAFVIYLVLGLFAARVCSIPVRQFFNALNNQDEKVLIVGNYGQALTRFTPGSKGQIEIHKTGQPIKVMAVLDEASQPIDKNDQVVIVRQEDNLYRITKF